ncbi:MULTISPECIES: hypothetical protein [unclassified Streptomyces]|uniref:hypothetical protein n=1 Tax=unclassified Streptomyces TaxID=2593676 RepID=UPI00093A1B82|nr:hypothetical protein [Streptomyces sp. TSRI0107]OKJ87923.1 hypothetical protein AMK31_12385 [Streptomyces sp. TSRI0107]
MQFKKGESMSKARLAAGTAAALATGLAMAMTFTSPATAATGDGRCESTEVCVYDAFDQKTSDGYYDLRAGHKNFHGKYWFRGDNGYIGDDISSVKGGSNADCEGWTIFQDVNYNGYYFHIPKGVEFNFTGGYGQMHNEASSLGRWRC